MTETLKKAVTDETNQKSWAKLVLSQWKDGFGGIGAALMKMIRGCLQAGISRCCWIESHWSYKELGFRPSLLPLGPCSEEVAGVTGALCPGSIPFYLVTVQSLVLAKGTGTWVMLPTRGVKVEAE